MYYSARKVFGLLRQPDRIGLLRVPGFHGSNDVEASLDWLDIQFGRSTSAWDNKLMFEWSNAQWLKESGEKVDPKRYPVHTPGDVTSLAAWEKASATKRPRNQAATGANLNAVFHSKFATQSSRSFGSG